MSGLPPGPNWAPQDAQSGAASTLFSHRDVRAVGGTEHVLYRGNDGHLHEVMTHSLAP